MIVDTALLSPDADDVQTYCGLDVCVTLEVMERLREMYGPRLEGATYAFSRALQAPALDMSLRGIRLDAALRDDAVERLTGLQVHLEERLNELSRTICDRPLNPKSPKQIIELFTEDMRLPPVWKSDKGVRKLSADEDALEKYAQYLYARPIVAHITAIRSLAKQIERLTTGVSADGRMHTSFGIGSTECISGDSLVWTKSGLRPISDIYESPMPLAVWNGATFVVPSRKVKFENQFGKHLVLKHGYELKCSNNHPVMTQRGWVEADKLTLDDSIEVNFGLRALYGNEYISSDSPFAVTKELCEFIGMWLADGSLDVETNSRYRCRLSNSFRPILERFAELAGSLFSVDIKVYEKEAYFSSKSHCMWMCNVLGLIANSGHGTASRKVIPSALLRAKPALLRALLRGLTLDTHITEHGIIYGTQSSVLRGQIQQCLLLLGIKSSKLNCGNSIKLMIPLKHCGRFLSLVGFVDSRKVSKIACMLNDKATSSWFEPESFGSRALVPISSITDWKGDVYDLTMPEDSPPQYIAQGITVHNTGRFSSSKFVDGSGGNLQNVSRDDLEDEHNISIRRIFIADEGQVLFSLDREQSESREIGYMIGLLFDDWGYLDAQEAGDTHTMVARLTWADDLPWTGNDREDRALAEKPFHRKGSRRQLAKILAHGSNLFGKPFTLARETYTTEALVERFQSRYFGRFPGIHRFHRWVAQQLQQKRELTTIFGRRRGFFDRTDDDATLRKAIAYLPQSATADRTNLGLYRVWANMRNDIQLLLQVHDSIVFQAPLTSDLEAIVQKAIELTEVALTSPSGRRYVVPGEMKWGFNLGNASEENPRGLKKWKVGKSASEARSLATSAE